MIYYFNHMSIGIVQQEVFQSILKNYFQRRTDLNFDLSNVINKIKNGVSLEVILVEESDSLTNRKLNALEETFKDQEFQLIMSKQENIKALIEASKKKSQHLLKFLLKKAGGMIELQLLDNYLSVSLEEQNLCKKIKDLYQITKEPTLHDDNQSNIKLLNHLKEEQLQLLKKDLQQLLGEFKTVKLNILIQLIMDQQSTDEQLKKIQEQMCAKQFRLLFQRLKSFELIKLKKRIHQVNLYEQKDQFLQLKRQQLQQIFKPCEFDATNLINAILKEESQIQILNNFQQQLKVRQYKLLAELAKSNKLEKIRESIKNRHLNTLSIQQRKEKKKELAQMSQNIRGFSNKLMQAIVDQKQQLQKDELTNLEEQLTGKQYQKLCQFIESQNMINFRKSLKRPVLKNVIKVNYIDILSNYFIYGNNCFFIFITNKFMKIHTSQRLNLFLKILTIKQIKQIRQLILYSTSFLLISIAIYQQEMIQQTLRGSFSERKRVVIIYSVLYQQEMLKSQKSQSEKKIQYCWKNNLSTNSHEDKWVKIRKNSRLIQD